VRIKRRILEADFQKKYFTQANLRISRYSLVHAALHSETRRNVCVFVRILETCLEACTHRIACLLSEYFFIYVAESKPDASEDLQTRAEACAHISEVSSLQ
jgi:hypothetical protein